MKFSFEWLKQIINLQKITFNELVEKLILSGFEIETIENKPNIKDITIDLSITTNRLDMTSIIGLAREISTIVNTSFLSDLYLSNRYNNKILPNNIFKISKSLFDIKINTITNLVNCLSPQWLINYLIGCDIKPRYVLNDIQEYIKIKWGQDIEIFDISKINHNTTNHTFFNFKKVNSIKEKFIYEQCLSRLDYEILMYKNTILSVMGLESNQDFFCNSKTSSIIVLGTICKPEYITEITEQLSIRTDKSIRHQKKILRCDFINAYNETLQLIATYGKGTIGLSQEYHKINNVPKKIFIEREYINNILGKTKKCNNRYLSVNRTFHILKQLKFQPIYNNNYKKFQITIPRYRENDIVNKIDVIEEIGRIHGFDYFNDNLKFYNKKGYISQKQYIIKYIKQVLRSYGLNEVNHYSLKNKSYIPNLKNISLYNPLIEDQSELRHNILQNLITTKIFNIKQKNLQNEIFEVGKIFTKNTVQKKDYIENIHIASILGNSNFSQNSWYTKAEPLSWFQAKGLLEEIFEKLNAQILWKKIDIRHIKTIDHSLLNMFKLQRSAILCNSNTKEEIGIFGEIKSNVLQKNIGHSTYSFEINIDYLIKTINTKNHLQYKIKPYSLYPSVTRDLSIILNQGEDLEYIKQSIINRNNDLLESIEIFNAYKDKKNLKTRNIGLRLIYRAQNRSLNKIDMKNIDNDINFLLQK
uniref:phenylalanine--tRNA ligase n=1 Tax=Plocamium cartilagineum TaxID=31452 RepID=A0A1C9CHZ5_PLOCA|nr:phenylalanyl-tRNA synthetase beta chain [Plocamium cartilagineum]AOM67979.1 phenylalanyl-tRNA synthetase beta chain [Plocamium cartilagineum]